MGSFSRRLGPGSHAWQSANIPRSDSTDIDAILNFVGSLEASAVRNRTWAGLFSPGRLALSGTNKAFLYAKCPPAGEGRYARPLVGFVLLISVRGVSRGALSALQAMARHFMIYRVMRWMSQCLCRSVKKSHCSRCKVADSLMIHV